MGRFRSIFNGLSAIVLLLFLYNRGDVLKSPFLHQNHKFSSNLASKSSNFPHRILSELNLTNPTNISIQNPQIDENSVILDNPSIACSGINDHSNPCEFLNSHPNCASSGFINYLKFFYCSCSNFPILGYLILFLWLAALFYMLGNTAADYFCCSLEKLSTLLKLPPTLAGVTLLPLGNGAPDVFASIAAFMSTGAGEVGLNSVLGGAVFVTCIVVGAISLSISEKNVQIDKKCFIRDISFFLLTLVSLGIILFIGKVTVLGAVLFVSIYVLYAFTVAANEILRKHAKRLNLDSPLLPVAGSLFSHENNNLDEGNVYSPLLLEHTDSDANNLNPSLPQWMWASNFAIYSNHGLRGGNLTDRPLWGWSDEREENNNNSPLSFAKFFLFMEMPLTVPRRLTIPLVEEERWSKRYAILSSFFAPLLISFLWSNTFSSYIIGALIGILLSSLAYTYTSSERPPRRFLLPWVLGGFFMSIIWFYILANELVSLLVALGVIIGINPSILGLTVLAWGNSMGDLVSNLALSINGGDGPQIAMSGCYAGPMFNILAGLGVSLLLSAWSSGPSPYELPGDGSVGYTLGFLIGGIVWSVVVLVRGDMRVGKVLGTGLVLIYVVFLGVRVGCAVGVLSLPGLS
ncbi:hypothetical protein LUZ60_005630 [Juncus effusus]|nr:hypothetical protein LUZ60_005630 [Juncus effusus]